MEDEEEEKEETKDEPSLVELLQQRVEQLEQQVSGLVAGQQTLMDDVNALSNKVLDTVVPEPEERKSVLDDVTESPFDESNIEKQEPKPKRKRGLTW